MGCGAAKYTQTNHFFDALKLTSTDVNNFYSIFTKLDNLRRGRVSLSQILEPLNFQNSPFARNLFLAFAVDENELLDFEAFVLSLWNVSTLSLITLPLYCFELVDNDKKGFITCPEFANFLVDIFGGKFSAERALRLVGLIPPRLCCVVVQFFLSFSGCSTVSFAGKDDIFTLGSRVFGIDEFEKIAKTNKSLLMPAFQTQIYIRNHYFGSSYWDNICERKVKLLTDEVVVINEYKDMVRKFVYILAKKVIFVF